MTAGDQIYHNYKRLRVGLNGKTLADACGLAPCPIYSPLHLNREHKILYALWIIFLIQYCTRIKRRDSENLRKEVGGFILSTFLVSCLLSTEIAYAVPDVLYESVPATVQDIDAGGPNTFNAQTFTPSASHTVSIISLDDTTINAQTSEP